jgi:hypothetical protein
MKLVNSRGPLSDFEVWNVTKQVVVSSTRLANNEDHLYLSIDLMHVHILSAG